MRQHRVYDLPLRIFHWLFAALFVTAFLIAKNVDDEALLYSYHMLAGLLLVFVVGLRLLWGFIGTKHSRFSNFALHPQDLFSYFRGILSGDKRKWAGHNPASSWASLLMFAGSLGLGITGILMAQGQKETFEDVHELLANGFLILVLLHVAGVILHALRHQDGIPLSMMDGKKSEVPLSELISTQSPGVALVFVGMVVSVAFALAKNFDTQDRSLKLFGISLQLGESENDEGVQENESTPSSEKVEEEDVD